MKKENEPFESQGPKLEKTHGVPFQVRNYWRKMMDSTRIKMSRGARFIAIMIPWARNENWRTRKEKKK